MNDIELRKRGREREIMQIHEEYIMLFCNVIFDGNIDTRLNNRIEKDRGHTHGIVVLTVLADIHSCDIGNSLQTYASRYYVCMYTADIIRTHSYEATLIQTTI